MAVMTGIDPHKGSHTAVAVTAAEEPAGQGVRACPGRAAGRERVTAWVVLPDGHRFDKAALIAHARTLLAGYKCPKRVFQIAELPRNQLGKIVRSALSQLG
jgi:malonyl-CoA/methylmalonyl-CoA synthetase